MPRVEVNGVNIAYELRGSGPTVVLTSGGNYPMDFCRIMAERLANRNRVLIWDRRCTGHSDCAYDPDRPEIECWVDDLHGLLTQLDIVPCIVGGTSWGSVVSLLLAHRYPSTIRALVLLWSPPDSTDVWRHISENLISFADAAEKGGGAMVADETDYLNNRFVESKGVQQLHEIDVGMFANAMRTTAKYYIEQPMWRGGLDDNALKAITAPTLVIPGGRLIQGSDDIGGHPFHTGAAIATALPNATLLEPHQICTREQIEGFLERWNKEDNALRGSERAQLSLHLADYSETIADFLSNV